jgi:hypothetical protein
LEAKFPICKTLEASNKVKFLLYINTYILAAKP